jgi:Ca-activated chloride channel family protein
MRMWPSVRAGIALAFAVVVVASPVVGGQRDEEVRSVSTFQSAIDLVSITATVQHRDGSFVTGLAANDFHVYEQGVPQTVTFFAAESVPLDVVLLIDNSSSMVWQLPTVQHAARLLVESLSANDRAAALSFGGVLRERVALTRTHQTVLDALAHLPAGGRTPLYDAIYLSLRTLSTPAADVRRRVIVVLTDGDDTSSMLSYEAVLDLAREAGISVYTILVRSPQPRRTMGAAKIDYEMRTLAADTGGRYLVAGEGHNLDAAYRSIALELGHQYSFGYVPAHSTGRRRFTPISVLVPGRNVVVRARRGYVSGE